MTLLSPLALQHGILSKKRLGGVFFLSVILALSPSCAGVSIPDQQDPLASSPEEVVEEESPGSGGGNVVTNPSSGGRSGLGGEPLGGDGDGDAPNGGSCMNDADCASSAGCQVCVLNSATFLFECQSDPDATECDDACVDTQTDNAHCGTCDNSCTGDLTCRSGDCACPNGEDQCDDTCTDLQNDTSNCGACDVPCEGDTPYCTDGSCTECPVIGETDCNGTCADLETDELNCGICGLSCDASRSQKCVAGTCEDPGSCANPDVDDYKDGRCGLTAVYQGALYECASSNVGGCATGGVFCQTVAPDQVPWGSTAWTRLMACP